MVQCFPGRVFPTDNSIVALNISYNPSMLLHVAQLTEPTYTVTKICKDL